MPWGNMYEFSTLLACLVVLGVPRHRRGHVQGADRSAGSSCVRRPHDGDGGRRSSTWRRRPLMPALNSYWRQIHVTSMIVASSLLATRLPAHDPLPDQGFRAERRALGRLRRAASRRRSWAASIDTRRAAGLRARRRRADRRRRARRRTRMLSAVRDARPLAYRFIPFGFPIWTFARDRRRDLGAVGLGPLLGLGPEGDLVVHHLGRSSRATCTRARRPVGGAAARRSSRWSASCRCSSRITR